MDCREEKKRLVIFKDARAGLHPPKKGGRFSITKRTFLHLGLPTKCESSFQIEFMGEGSAAKSIPSR